ncbi:transposase [Trichonephila clavipes]|nr:transposase [Trichonephila clavipes]
MFIYVTRYSNTRAVGDGPRDFEPPSSDEDDTLSGIYLSKLPHHINARIKSLERLIVHQPRCMVFSGNNSGQAGHVFATIITNLPQPRRGMEVRKELLPYGQTLNSDLYYQQLDRLKLAIGLKWPELANRRGVVLHQDNVMPLISVVTHQKLWKLGLEVLMHSPYSLDLAPNNYHLFLALQDFHSDKKLGSREDCEIDY